MKCKTCEGVVSPEGICWKCGDDEVIKRWHKPKVPETQSDEAPVMKTKTLTLPTDSKERKGYPLFSGVMRYFPAALAGVAHTSQLGNDKHNPGEPLYHARGKSTDHADCILRHLTDTADLLAAFERGDPSVTKEQILAEASSIAWRALAYSQELYEKLDNAPLAPGAKK